MILIWIAFLIEALVLSLLKDIVIDLELICIVAISIHILFTTVVLISKKKYNIVFLCAFLARVALMVWDLYARNIFLLPGSGADTELYYNWSVAVSQNISLINEEITGGIYSKVIGILFYFIGPQRMFAQYINVILGLSVVIIIYKILIMLEIDSRITKIIILIAAFFPNSMVMSAILLREIFPTFFVAASLFFFIKWFESGYIRNMLFSILMLGLACMFHAGVIGIFIGYAFAFLFYKRKDKIYRFNGRTVFAFVLMAGITYFSYTQLNHIIFGKFINVNNISDIYSVANYSAGGSSYLKGLEINNFGQLILYGPVKMFYFLTAPLPMDWRGMMDIFTFFADSMLYLGTILYFIKNRKRFANRRDLILALVLALIGVTIIFGIGVGNAGTAIRHRQKILPIFLIWLALMMDKQQKALKTI